MRISDWSSDVCSSDLEDSLSGRSGDGGDIRTWTTDEMEVSPRGVRFKGLNISDDADQTRFNNFLGQVAVMLPQGATPLSEIGRKQETEKTEAKGFVSFETGMEKWAQTLPEKTPPKRKTKGANRKQLTDVKTFFDAHHVPNRPTWAREHKNK